MSVFLAVDLDLHTRTQVAALMDTLRPRFEAKWLRTDKLHCTLVFLGNPTAAQLAAWPPLLDALALRHQGFSLQLAGAGTFVTARAPSVLWLGVGGALEPLHALQADAARTLGGEEREYLPHVTLARARQEGSLEVLLPELAPFQSAPFAVRHLALYESNNHTYRVLHQSPLL